MLSERKSAEPLHAVATEPLDRCRYNRDFERASVDCPAFQRAQFIAATSYGKPLGTHVACAHMTVGEVSVNHFYPRCSLGSEVEKMRSLATMGPGRIGVLRGLNAEFETHNSDALRALVTAKAAALADPAGNRAGQEALAGAVRDFVAALATFVDTHADRIAEIGVVPTDLAARAERVLPNGSTAGDSTCQAPTRNRFSVRSDCRGKG